MELIGLNRKDYGKIEALHLSHGDIIFFDWESDGVVDHVGIVEKVEGNLVYTVEGNNGDKCVEKSYTINSSEIFGYGTPKYK